MSTPDDWRRGYARQADADFKAWELYEKNPIAVAAECHKLLFLQMSCEKLCKAHLILNRTPPEALQGSHAYVAKPLIVVLREQLIIMRQDLNKMDAVILHVKYLAQEIEVLNPAVDRGGHRPDNCEYPWDDDGGKLHSPLDWSFNPSRLLTAPAGRTFLKLLRLAIDRVLGAG